ncbi:MAG: hypothetical protein ACC633_08045 [Anaerolineales bacterium]
MNTEELNLIILGIFSLAAIPVLYWIFRDPSEALNSYLSKALLSIIILAYSGMAVLSLLMGDRFFSALFVAYPLLYAVVFRKRIRSTRIFSTRFTLLILPFFLLWFEELFAVLDYHGPILQHFIFYIGYYVGYVLVIYLFYRRWRFSFAQVLTIGGLFGMLIEQEFMLPKLFLQGISGNLDALLFLFFAAPFIFLVYGLYLAAPFLLFYEEIKVNPKAGKRQVFFLFFAILTVPLLTWGIWTILLSALGIDLAGII